MKAYNLNELKLLYRSVFEPVEEKDKWMMTKSRRMVLSIRQ